MKLQFIDSMGAFKTLSTRNENRKNGRKSTRSEKLDERIIKRSGTSPLQDCGMQL